MLKQNSKLVAVVEDDRHINELICYNLAKENFLPTSIFDGKEAEKILSEEHYDIVILDLMLPGLDGFSICRNLKSRPDSHKTFVVILSARSSEQDKMLAQLLGADGYLTKPFSINSLMNLIKEFSNMLDKKVTVVCKK
ncbi:MAG: response regulator [Candidatus Omnitrophica bacterium]|nr:response regulator [Candidatus Omnitrophota bacterium]